MSRNWFSWWCTTKIKDNITGNLSKDKPGSRFPQKQKKQRQRKNQNPFYASGVGSTTTTTENGLCGDHRPFYIVLIDLKKAAKWQLHCVKKPLMDNDLKFVAISYRWGEVQETTVDTGVGYLATITSFHLDDFFDLCSMITQEVDLQHMDYVWVDAICVNQSNLEQRKATIYHMTDIYERASYLLAVPDLHLRYLDLSSKNNHNIISGSLLYGKYIYHLLQGNIQKLFDYDQQFLDQFNVPKEKEHPHLRRLLTNYTEHFTTGLATCRKMNHDYKNDHHQKAALQHIYETTHIRTPPCLSLINNDNDNKAVVDKVPVGDTLATINILHTCDDAKWCPFKQLFYSNDNNNNNHTTDDRNDQQWKQRIPERSQAIRRSVVFLVDLVLDWSTRAWVVSEFHIAKDKPSHKMKYWFIQLRDVFQVHSDDDAGQSFFTFDFNEDDGLDFSCDGNDDGDGSPKTMCHVTGDTHHTPENLFHAFHGMMRQQLSQQTFLEKMLKSKASRHEDRFHAILSSSEYKSILDNKAIVDDWHNVTTLIAVKLELYKWMTTKHKLELLFLAGDAENMGKILPSFATTDIIWKSYPTLMAMDDPVCPGNFDLSMTSSTTTIRLMPHYHHYHHQNGCHSYKLNLKPREYYRLLNKYLVDRYYYKENFIYSKLLALNLIHDDDDDDEDDRLNGYDFIVIPGCSKQATTRKDSSFQENDNDDDDNNNNNNNNSNNRNMETIERRIVLIGCMARNIWVLTHFNAHVKSRFSRMILHQEGEQDWQFCQCDEKSLGFDIY